jgi:hypothetical protein
MHLVDVDVENYALKLALGFAAHPGVHVSRDGRRFGGVYLGQGRRPGA